MAKPRKSVASRAVAAATAAAVAPPPETVTLGEGVFADRRTVATGGGVEKALRAFLRTRMKALDDACGDPFMSSIGPALDAARASLAAHGDRPVKRGSVEDASARLIGAVELANAAAAAGRIGEAMELSAAAGALAERLRVADRWQKRIASHEIWKEGVRIRNDLKRGAVQKARLQKYAAAQIEADRLMIEKPRWSNERIAALAGELAGLAEKPDSVMRNLTWPEGRRRPRKGPAKFIRTGT